MKKLNTSVALAALAAVLSTPAIAADIEAPVPEAADWTAFHIGAGVGGNFAFVEEDAFGFSDKDAINNDFVAFGAHESDLGDAGFFGTVEAGFDWQLGSSVVLGVLANYDFGKTKMDNDSTAVLINENNNVIVNDGTFSTQWKIGDSWGVGARAGFLAMDNALIYVLGGYTQARVKTEASLEIDNNGTFVSTSDKSWEDGWFVGGGIEALLTDSISLKAEYRYNDYGKVDVSEFDSFVNVEEGIGQEGDITVHSVRAVLSYRFGLGL
jgi:outer membrane immunogenic protein